MSNPEVSQNEREPELIPGNTDPCGIVGEAEQYVGDTEAGDHLCEPHAADPSNEEWTKLVNGLITIIQKERGEI